MWQTLFSLLNHAPFLRNSPTFVFPGNTLFLFPLLFLCLLHFLFFPVPHTSFPKNLPLTCFSILSSTCSGKLIQAHGFLSSFSGTFLHPLLYPWQLSSLQLALPPPCWIFPPIQPTSVLILIVSNLNAAFSHLNIYFFKILFIKIFLVIPVQVIHRIFHSSLFFVPRLLSSQVLSSLLTTYIFCACFGVLFPLTPPSSRSDFRTILFNAVTSWQVSLLQVSPSKTAPIFWHTATILTFPKHTSVYFSMQTFSMAILCLKHKDPNSHNIFDLAPNNLSNFLSY